METSTGFSYLQNQVQQKKLAYDIENRFLYVTILYVTIRPQFMFVVAES